MAEDIPLISEKKLNEFGRDYVKILYRLLKKKKKDATGALINSLDYRIRPDAMEIELIANDYLTYVDQGRRRGSYPPIRPLIKWAEVRGISRNAAYAIQKSIYKFGIKPTNVIQETVKEIESSPTLTKKYEDEITNNIIEMVNYNFNIKQK